MNMIKKFDEYVEGRVNEVVSSNIHEDDMLLEMAKIGNMNSQFEVHVWSNDPGYVPHFHVWNKDKTFHTCVEIKRAKYFHHTGKESVFNAKQRKELYEFLNTYDKESEMTFWKYLLITWNKNNSKIKVDTKQDIPNYIIIE